MLFRLLLTFYIATFSIFIYAKNDNPKTTIHEVTAHKGDGVISLLRRYKLNQYQSNVKEFYRLNGIEINSVIYSGKKYKLPVTLFKYDGKSIRSTINNDDWDKAIRIQEYNENLLSIGIRKSHYSDSKILWVPHHELNSEKIEVINVLSSISDKPTTLKTKSSLFGKRYSDIKIIDQTLKNRVYYIISGHGGPDPGAMCSECDNTLCEDEYAYDVALRLARNLMQHGAIVEIIIQDKNDGIRDEKYLKCDKDERLNNGKAIPLNQIAKLNQRAFRVNDLYKKHQKNGVKEQLMVAIHVDSRSKSQRQDVFFYHFPKSKNSEKLAIDVKETFEDKYAFHQKGRNYKGYVKDRNLHILRVSRPKAIFIELANIKNPFDHKRILLKENRQALANWIYEGITKRVSKKSNQVVASS